jgi:hypothetical protein
MENDPKPKNELEELQEFIAHSAVAVETEFNRTANSWLACFGSRIFVIETIIHGQVFKKLLPAEKCTEARFRLEKLKEKLLKLKEQYPDKETILPDVVKKELLKELDILG